MASNTPDLLLIELIDRIGAVHTQPGGATRASAEAALRQLYDITSSKLYGVALRVVGNREWAEDVLQDAYLNIWRIAGDYRAALSPPMAWMGVIVRSRALDFLRRRGSERVDLNQPLDDFITDTVAGDQPNPIDTAHASECAWALHQCLARLESKHREVVSLAYLRDLSHGELAAQLKLPLGTVKTWIRRGLEQLRGCMARFT
ncbi:MAG TPA: sigma-70 family RNA polymerase sigma factor [Burkholderiaceae bacterium]